MVTQTQHNRNCRIVTKKQRGNKYRINQLADCSKLILTRKQLKYCNRNKKFNLIKNET